MKQRAPVLFMIFGFIVASLVPAGQAFAVAFDTGFSFEIRGGSTSWETAIYDTDSAHSATYNRGVWPDKVVFEYMATWNSASGIATFSGSGGGQSFNLTKDFSTVLAGYAPTSISFGMNDSDRLSGLAIIANDKSFSSGIAAAPGSLAAQAISVPNPSLFTITGTFTFYSDILGNPADLQGWIDLKNFEMASVIELKNLEMASVPDASIFFLLGPAILGLGVFGRKKRK
jgi:hypothetical protein